jgi:hypothetical protein
MQDALNNTKLPLKTRCVTVSLHTSLVHQSRSHLSAGKRVIMARALIGLALACMVACVMAQARQLQDACDAQTFAPLKPVRRWVWQGIATV